MYLEPERNTQEKLKNKHNQNKHNLNQKIKIKLQIFRILFPQKKFELIKNYISKIENKYTV